jgi:outer membrane protein TolC
MLASEANLARIKAELAIAKNDYNRTRENLKLVMNMPDGTVIEPARELLFKEKSASLGECLKTAFARRRDYLISKIDVDIRGIELKMKSNAKWPEIDLVGTWAFNGLEPEFSKAWDKATGADHSYYYAGIEINLPVENKQARSEFKKARFEKEKAVIRLRDVERKIITEINNSYEDVKAFEKSIPYVFSAVDLQKEKLQEEVKSFTYGRSNTKRIIDYQNDLLNAQREKTEYLYRHKAAVVDLERAMNVIIKKYKDLL